jgi:ABC-type transporter Mla maintaining outer membrane lipid asymmetry ATPase subunit MlaF
MNSEAIIHISGLQKNYSGLRPLRIRSLEVGKAERVALGGLDAVAAELLVNLVTGATLPDAGSVNVFGQSTAAISDGDAWLSSLDRFGIVSPRAVMLEGSTLEQNLALPFTLQIDAIADDVRERVSSLAAECGIARADLSRQVGELPAHVRLRAHLARAVALEPALLLVEHPTVDVADGEKVPLARDVAAVAGHRGIAALIITTDVEFAETVAHRSLALQPATGDLVPWRKKRGWFR